MDGGAGTAMEVLLQNLINVTKEEIALIRGLDKEAEQLKSSLTTIQAYLSDAEKKCITQDSVKAWLHELEAVAFEADDVLDEFNYHALHKKVKAMKTTMNNAFSFFSSSDHTLRPHHMACRIKEINTSLDLITKRATDLNLQSIFVDASASVPDFSLETDSYTLDPVFIGRDDDVPRLVEVLTKSPQERILSILAVVGMGGMGKTTLTRKVFNHHEIKTRFGCHSWVYVSRTFNPLLIFKKFLASLPDEDKTKEEIRSSESNALMLQKSYKAKTDEVETREGILEKLEQALKNKTYLLVLDDVWNEDIMKWEDFIESLTGVTSTKGNGIIITTRSSEVASIVNPLQTHHLNGLSDDDCWSIIKAKVSEMGKLIPSEFETVGRKIARKCHGLPLAAKVVGGVLRHKSEQEWISIEQKWLSDVDGDYISRILKLSYDNLSSAALKKCFAYCSIFSKGHIMAKQGLIELWMAEGFLQPDERNDMESLGDKFVNVLLRNSLLQVVPGNMLEFEDEEMCVMHDLVHDLASSILGSLKVRYMCHGDESSHIPKESAKHLRTLHLKGGISAFQLTHLKSLHVLSFGRESYRVRKSQLSLIMKLIHLRRLDISETRIKYLPDSIGELHHLQTLRADTKFLRELPKTVKYLINLRHLYICEQINLPPEIGRLSSLGTLTHFTVRHENGCQIEEIGSLKNLKGKLKIFNLEKVKKKEEALKANLFQKSNLLELSFIWSRGRDEIHKNEEEVLEGLQPHSNLKKLEIKRFRGKKFPLWIMKMAVPDEGLASWLMLKNLVEVTLEECYECEEIPMLGLLPNLKHLYLRKLRNVKSLNSSFYGIGVGPETISVFPVLERLEVRDMFELREWADVDEVKVFPRLLYLRISNCKQLRSIPGHSFGSLKELDIDWLDEFECLPDGLFHINQNLSKFKISHCPKLRVFPDGLGTLCSLEELIIFECLNLKSIGNPIGQSQATLRQLWIRGCKGLMELPHELVESWAPSLENVSLWSLSSLNNLPKLIDCMAKPTRLKYLYIVGVPKFMATRRIESWAFHCLQELRIDVSVKWSRENSVGIKETCDGILQGCNPHSLVRLDLIGLEIWECLPESIQNLTGLSSLQLCNFGIEELPEWFGNLSSLESLFLRRCKRLRCLFGDDTLRRLTKLRHISANGCPELRIDSKWRNNNNLFIYVDDKKDEHGAHGEQMLEISPWPMMNGWTDLDNFFVT